MCFILGVIVCGSGASGKSTCIENLIDAVNEHATNKLLDDAIKSRLHRLKRLNILAAADMSLMFGHIKPSGDWAEGVFTSIWKHANRQHSVTKTTTWLCFDAPITDVWCEKLKSVLDEGKVQCSCL